MDRENLFVFYGVGTIFLQVYTVYRSSILQCYLCEV